MDFKLMKKPNKNGQRHDMLLCRKQLDGNAVRAEVIHRIKIPINYSLVPL